MSEVLFSPESPARVVKSDTRGAALSERRAQIIALRKGGLGPRQIARQLGITASTVAGVLWRAKLTAPHPPRQPRPPREKAPRTPRERLQRHSGMFVPKWGPEKVAEVRTLYLVGVTMTEISKRTGVPMGTLPALWRDLPRRRPVRWSSRAKPRAFRLEVLVAALTGESQAKAAKRLGCSEHSIPNWQRDATLVAEAQALADEINVRRAAEREAERVAKEQAEADEVARIAAINAPILAAIENERHRSMMMTRAAGLSLEEISKRHGVTRQRIRQIEVRYRVGGLIIPHLKPLSAASIKTLYVPTGKSRGRPPKVPKVRPDFWSAAHEALERMSGRRPNYRITDEERKRRSDVMKARLNSAGASA